MIGISNNKNFSLSVNGLGAPLLVIVILAMMLIPMPAFGLDLLFTFNIALSLIVMLVTVYALRPLEFSSFPTVLLVATMLRLALNIASTRVVLLEGHTGTGAAGSVIESFGNFVIGGNYAVGLVVFSILVIINFVVVTKGAGRVSEVSARFVLDAMPGKQMAIDADMNSGTIDQEEARQRRQEVSQEADFYGAMDGASKFVRGDAIAGLLILFINIGGGLAIGMGSHGLDFDSAVKNYTLLAIGDGLVAQVPSLLLSMATAVIVTRVSTAQDMGDQIILQLFGDRRALLVTASIVGAIGLVPGMPNLAFLSLSLILFAYWYFISTAKSAEVESSSPNVEEENVPVELSWDDVKSADVLGLEVGYRLIPLVDTEKGGKLPDRIKGVRRKVTEELGFLIHPVHIKDNPSLSPTRYRVVLHGVTEAEGDIYPERELAISADGSTGVLEGIAVVDPAFGMDAMWIEPGERDHALSLGFTVVDAGTVIATHLSKVLHENSSTLLGHEEVQKLLDKLSLSSPKLVEELIPSIITMPVLVKVLQNLLADSIPLTDMRTVMQALAESSGATTDPEMLTAQVRIALRRLITGQINGIDEELSVITLASDLEQLWLKSIQSGVESGIGMEPGLAERFYQSLADSAQRQEQTGQQAVLLVNPQLRPWLSSLVKHTVPNLKVLAYTEIAENRRLKVIANIGNHLNGETQPVAA